MGEFNLSLINDNYLRILRPSNGYSKNSLYVVIINVLFGTFQPNLHLFQIQIIYYTIPRSSYLNFQY